MSKKVERSGKKKKKVEDSDDQDYKKKFLLDYSTPGVVGNLGGVSDYAKAQKILVGRAKRELEKAARCLSTRSGVRHGRTMGGRSDRSTIDCQTE